MTEHSPAAIAAFPMPPYVASREMEMTVLRDRTAFDLGAAHTLAATREEIARALFFLELPGEDRLWDEHRSHVGENAHLWCTIPVYFARADAVLASGALVDVREVQALALTRFSNAEMAINGATMVVERALKMAAEIRAGVQS